MAKFDKQKLRREIERERRERAAVRLRELRVLIAEARHARDEAIAVVRSDCRLKRQELRESCNMRAARARASGNQAIAERRAAATDEKKYERMLRQGDKPSRLRSTRRERSKESDDEVRANLSADMVPIFDAVRKHIKGTERKSRTEAFLEWAEENPGEVFSLMQHQADRELARLIAEQERLERQTRRARLAADVPF